LNTTDWRARDRLQGHTAGKGGRRDRVVLERVRKGRGDEGRGGREGERETHQ
jgi:hypothetical protein